MNSDTPKVEETKCPTVQTLAIKPVETTVLVKKNSLMDQQQQHAVATATGNVKIPNIDDVTRLRQTVSETEYKAGIVLTELPAICDVPASSTSQQKISTVLTTIDYNKLFREFAPHADTLIMCAEMVRYFLCLTLLFISVVFFAGFWLTNWKRTAMLKYVTNVRLVLMEFIWLMILNKEITDYKYFLRLFLVSFIVFVLTFTGLTVKFICTLHQLFWYLHNLMRDWGDAMYPYAMTN